MAYIYSTFLLHNLSKTNWLSQIQYRAARLVSGALMYTNKSELQTELAWESIESRATIVRLSVFQKVHFNLTRPLIRSCMTENDFFNRPNVARAVLQTPL